MPPANSDTPIHFLNIEYFFNRIFEFFLWVRYELFGTPDIRAAINSADDPFHMAEAIYFEQKNAGLITDTHISLSSWFKNFFSFATDTAPTVTETINIATGSAQSIGSSVTAFDIFSSLRGFLTFLFLFLVTVMVYSFIRWRETVKKQKELFDVSYRPVPVVVQPKNEKWQIVLNHLNSGNPPEWRLAILEADNMLAGLLEDRGYEGEGVGGKLTNAHFATIEDAWDAHKVRNRIAHEGVDFHITEHEARRVLALYERVFTEFNYI